MLKSTPPLRYVTQSELDKRREDRVLHKAIQDLLQLKAIQVVPKDTKVFVSSPQAGEGTRVREKIHPQHKGDFFFHYSGFQEDCSSLTHPGILLIYFSY